jgi:hypothetical protein
VESTPYVVPYKNHGVHTRNLVPYKAVFIVRLSFGCSTGFKGFGGGR